ncbi:macrolide family glycosyltransferase [Streptomyces sp. NPDC007088]|uniref:macrolide family glycosyltransferase n=1 Tax=Streptomyces sp. NPDC007088 TaxID=3364773 RepID=UPI0036A410BE
MPRPTPSAPPRAHVAVIGVPAISHVLPSLEIVRELVRRGHRVTVANDPLLADVLTATGAEFVPFSSRLPPVRKAAWPQEPIAGMTEFLDDARRVLPQLRAAYGNDPADLYLYDIGAYAARALAEAQDRPLLQLSPTFVGWEGYEEEVAAALWRLPGADAYRAAFTAWLRESGAKTLDMDAFVGPPARSLALVPRAMQPHAEKVNTDVVTFVGPCSGERARRETWRRPEDAETVVLVSLGSAYTRQPDFYRRCLAAFGGLPGLHLVLQIGADVDPAELGPLPPHVEAHSWVPQLAVLEQADLFVTHAGMGGCAEGLLTGTPMIAVPQAAEQFVNADRLVALGVARRLDTDEADVTRLRAALTALSGEEVTRRCARLREQTRAEGGAPRAAGLIEELLPR